MHEETQRAYQELMAAGKIRAIGASNYSLGQFKGVQRLCPEDLPCYGVLQLEFNLRGRAEYEQPVAADRKLTQVFNCVAAVTLAGALKGIEEGCDPGPAAEGNSYNGDHVSDLPRTWLEAIDRLEGSSFIRDVFGPSLHQGFVSI